MIRLKLTGYDISSAQNAVIWPGNKVVIKTDLCVAIPENHYGKLFDR